jgi:restriction endonuclease S subunit
MRNQNALLNKGWEIKPIGVVCKVIAGQSPEGEFYNKIGNGLPFYQTLFLSVFSDTVVDFASVQLLY